jgi:dolichyl-phosphate beta-glucosyltransferase
MPEPKAPLPATDLSWPLSSLPEPAPCDAAPGEQLPMISVVIPCYNEGKNLARGVLDEVDAYMRQQAYAWEVIVVNDESSDDSRELIQRFVTGRPGYQLVDIPHGGKPAAVWAGIQAACGGIVLFTDMDQSTPISELAKLLPWYNQGYDVVIGSRGMTREGFSLFRKLGSVAFRTFRRTFMLREISDTQCGFKSSRRAAALQVFPRLQFFKQTERPKGWKVSAYDVELLFLFEQAGHRIKEIEVDWSNRDRSDTKQHRNGLMQYMDESLDMLREIMRVKRNQMRGFYDA